MISSGALAKFLLTHVHSISCVNPRINYESNFVTMIKQMEFVNFNEIEKGDDIEVSANFNGHYLIKPTIIKNYSDLLEFDYPIFLDLLDYIEGQLEQ